MKEEKHNDMNNDFQFVGYPAMNAGTSSNKINENILQESPICIASAKGEIEIVKSYLDKGMDINKKDSSNLTPIMHAALNGHRILIKLLVEKGAKISYALLGIVKAKMNAVEKEVLYGKEDSYEITLWRNLLDYLIQEGKKQ